MYGLDCKACHEASEWSPYAKVTSFPLTMMPAFYVRSTHAPSPGSQPHMAQCRNCGLLQIQRPAGRRDIVFCSRCKTQFEHSAGKSLDATLACSAAILAIADPGLDGAFPHSFGARRYPDELLAHERLGRLARRLALARAFCFSVRADVSADTFRRVDCGALDAAVGTAVGMADARFQSLQRAAGMGDARRFPLGLDGSLLPAAIFARSDARCRRRLLHDRRSSCHWWRARRSTRRRSGV